MMRRLKEWLREWLFVALFWMGACLISLAEWLEPGVFDGYDS